jgi:competence protein ComEC
MQGSVRPPQSRDRGLPAPGLPLLWLSLAFLAGILLASLVSLAAFVWLILAMLVLTAGWLLGRRPGLIRPSRVPYSLVIASFFSLCLGAARYQSTQFKPTPSDIAFYNDRQYDLLVTGWLTEPPDYRDTYTNLRIRVERVDTGEIELPVHGLLLARVSANETYRYGERLRLRGQLQTPAEEEDFSYRDYLARQGIYSSMSSAEATRLPGRSGNILLSAVYALKEESLARVYRLFPDPEASLLAGILLGVDTGLPASLQQAFKNTGTAHIIAISGFNIAIIAGIFVSLFSRVLGPRRGALAAILGIAFYTFLVGADAAVVRAALMGTLSIFALQVGRRQQGLNTLAFVAALMTVFNPLLLWDIGFQLSFFATLGLILYAEPLQEFAMRVLTAFQFPPAALERFIGPLSDYVLLTLAAQLTTIPIMAYQFKRISLVSFIANPFILPAQPAVMILGGLAVFISMIFFPLGQLAAWAAWPLTAYTIRMVEFFDAIPHGTIVLGNFSGWFAVLFYALLLTVTFAGSRIQELSASLRARFGALSPAVMLSTLFVLTLITWRAVADAPDGNLHITFLDVGSADAVLVETPRGGHILINGGQSPSSLSDGLGRRLPPFTRKLDWLVVASTDEQQVAALPRVLERYPPEHVLWAGNEAASFSARKLDEFLTEQSIPITRAEAGQTLDLGQGAVLKILTAGPRGAVVLIEWNEFRALLPIGANFDTLDELEYGNAVGPVTALSLAESGFSQLSPPDWIENLNPRLIALSVAAGDKDGLPDRETLEAAGGYPLLRTDQNGWIAITTDGIEMWVEIEKPQVHPEDDLISGP